MSKEIVYWLLRSKRNFVPRLGNLYTHASVIRSLENIAQTVYQKSGFSFRDIHVFLVDITLLCLLIAKLEQIDRKRVFVGASVNWCYSMPGLGNVKKVVVKVTIYVCFFVFLRKRNKMSTNWKKTFWQTSISFSQYFLQKEFIGGAAIKTLPISNFNDS